MVPLPAELEQQAAVPTGPLLPLLPPKPISRRLPSITPHPASASPIRPGWVCETVAFPAAFPRSYKGSTKRPDEPKHNPAAAPGGGRADPKEALARLIEPQIKALQQPVSVDDAAELDRQEQLVTVANRYRPARRREGAETGLTLVFSHANGFYREVWEPTLAVLLERLEANGRSLPVDEVWALDCVNQGDAGLLNDDVLGDAFNWADHGRDLLNFIISFSDSPSLASSPSPSSLLRPADVPAVLTKLDNVPLLPPGPSLPSARTYRGRLFVGIGHSLGGGATAYAASANPSLFSSLIFVDPVLPKPDIDTRGMGGLTTGALMRRETWKTREEARDSFLKKPFFQAWDRRVLDGYVEHGLKDVNGGVALKVTAKNEALTFMDPMAVASRRACSRLALIPPTLPTHFVLADDGRSVLDDENIEYMIGQVPHASSSRVKGSGHLVVHEKPDDAAQHLVEFLEKTYSKSVRAKL